MVDSLLQLTERVSRANRVDDIEEAALDYLASTSGLARAALLLFDEQGVMTFRAWRGLSDTYRAALTGHSPWTPRQHGLHPVVVDDVAAEESLGDLRRVVLAEGIRSLLFLPLQANGHLVGKLMLYGERPAAFDEELVRRLQAGADQVALAMDRLSTGGQLRDLTAVLVMLIEHLPSGVAFISPDGIVRHVNRALSRIFGVEPDDMQGRPVAEILMGVRGQLSDAASADEALALLDDRQPHSGELRLRDGRILERFFAPMFDGGLFRGTLWQLHDVTVRRRMEQRLLQAQQMECIGRLAGGVAHDFNNLLTAVIGYVDLAAASLPQRTEARAQLDLALEAADQAAQLTGQLLAFARRAPFQPTTLDLNDVLTRMAPMIRRLLPEDIDIQARLQRQACWVRADAGQLEQIVANLVLNAREAMPGGGALSLATLALPETDEVLLEVADTGMGMSEDVRARAFEPFSSSQAGGLRPGPGLAAVYGIVQQCNGHIELESAPGEGARFRVWLPAAPAPVAHGDGPDSGRPWRSGTILLVEDAAPLRALVRLMLERAGHAVLVAASADEALEVAAHAGTIDLLLTDQVMPGLSGTELAQRLVMTRPGMRVLLMSGYAPVVDDQGVSQADTPAFIAKPFSAEALEQRVREVLGQQGALAGPLAR